MSYGPDVEVSVDGLASIATPTQLVWGGLDSYGGRQAADHMATVLPDARLEFLSDAGHLPWLDDAVAVGTMIEGFLLGRDHDLATAA